MDVDPLADTVPPRYAIESDEEEDEYNPLKPSASADQNQEVDVEIIGDFPKDGSLVVATGDIAKYWARGADIGEQSGGVYVNKVQVGLAFRPAWANATIIVSEALTRLPAWAMHKYVSAILDTLKPSRVSLLDTYPVPSYISESQYAIQDAPFRYLSTSTISSAVKPKVEPFTPPNLISSTSASFLSVLGTNYTNSNGLLILVPSPHVPHPLPKILEHSNFFHLSEDRFEWSTEAMNSAQDLLLLSIEEQVPPRWKGTKDNNSGTTALRKRGEVGEGGMYI